MKKILFCLIFFVVQLFFQTAAAESFYIEQYAVSARVNKDKTVDVYEEITVYFNAPSHGIYRTIPLKGDTIENITVSEKHSKHYEGGGITIKIGDAERYVTQRHKYSLSYRLNIYDRLPEFYYNIIGTDWQVPINFAYFNVEMPKTIEADKVGLSVGRYGRAGFDGEALFEVKDNVISGVTKQALEPGEGITLRVEVPEDYFEFLPDTTSPKVILWLILLTFLSFAFWLFIGKDEHVTPVVSFYAPKNIFNSDAELILREKVSSRSLVALIIELAEQGYLKIENRQKSFTLHKLREYDGPDNVAGKLFEELFYGGRTSRTKSDLSNSKRFYKECKTMIKAANSRKGRFFTPASLSKMNVFLMILLMLGTCSLSLYALMGYRLTSEVLTAVIFYGIFLLLFFQGTYRAQILSNLLVIGVLGSSMFPQLQYIVSVVSPQNLKVACFGGICFLLTLIFYIQFPKLNIQGQQIKGQLKGLKKFIRVAEKKRLEQMVEEDPSYFYKILPYAYILGVSDKWIKQFEDIMIAPREEFGNRMFTRSSFYDFSNGFSQTTLPSKANGGISRSSGGGGFSGGGHGGGGGGSW